MARIRERLGASGAGILTRRCDATMIRAEWVKQLHEIARNAGLEYDPTPVHVWIPGSVLIAAVRSLGGTVTITDPFFGWTLNDSYAPPPKLLEQHTPELIADNLKVHDFTGACRIDLDGARFIALRIEDQYVPDTKLGATILGGPSLEATFAFASRLWNVCAEFRSAEIRAYGTTLQPTGDREVDEDDLVLADDFKCSLLNYVDGFWKSAELCQQLRITPTRGVLLVGAPGTGKTLTVRHLLHRYRERELFVYMRERHISQDQNGLGFRMMVENISKTHKPSVVLIEDIDHIIDSESVTREFLLNVLDGLFEPQCPVLWIATSNDPTRMEDNLLDRPGRFDRVFVFPRPAVEERAKLVTRYSPWPVESSVVEEIATRSEGLTGAHMREVCYSAAMSAAQHPTGYPNALRTELERVFEQHQSSRSYHSTIAAERKVGFGARRIASE